MRPPVIIRSPRSPQRSAPNGQRSGFTLIELMVVMGILAVVMTISIPTVYRQLHPDSLQKALEDFMDGCRYARGRAILEGTVAELVIRPHDRTITVVSTGEKGRGEDSATAVPTGFSPSVSGEEWRMGGNDKPKAGSSGGSESVFSAKFSDRIIFEGVGINGLDWTEDEESRVKFYPNGTSDEMSVVLLQSERGERRNITLEVVTALAEFETDPTKFKVR